MTGPDERYTAQRLCAPPARAVDVRSDRSRLGTHDEGRSRSDMCRSGRISRELDRRRCAAVRESERRRPVRTDEAAGFDRRILYFHSRRATEPVVMSDRPTPLGGSSPLRRELGFVLGMPTRQRCDGVGAQSDALTLYTASDTPPHRAVPIDCSIRSVGRAIGRPCLNHGDGTRLAGAVLSSRFRRQTRVNVCQASGSG